MTPPVTGFENIAHRGASLEAPENTLAAFDLALRQGADRIELDVQLSGDGRVVVTHDRTLDRTTNVATRFPDRGPWDLRDFTWRELSALEVSAPSSNGHPAEPLATLAEVLAHLEGRTTLLLELKDPARNPGLAEAVADELSTQDWWLDPAAPGRLLVQSFDPTAVEHVRPLLSAHVGYAWLVTETATPDLATVPTWARVVVVDHAVAGPAVVADVHATGRSLWAYTVNDPARMEALVALGFDGIITDDPACLSALSARDRSSDG